MKKIFFPSVFLLLTSYFSYSQTAVIYNATQNFYVDAGAMVFVDGDVFNDASGHIKNKGDIHLTKDWTNKEIPGGLDPTTGTVFLDGGAQFIQGTQTSTFNNLKCIGNGKKTLNITTVVGGNTGVLSLLADPFDLNSKTLIVTNPLPAAVTRTSGYIISETAPAAGYGTVEWRMGNSAAGNNYTYPFATVSGSYIPFEFDVTTAGVQSATGNLAVATYPTNVTASPNNRPLPNTVGNLNDASGNESAIICADRFWITDANNYTAVPKGDITFSYTNSEWDNSGGSTNNIVEDSLKAWRWNGAQWLNPSAGTDNPSASPSEVVVPGVNAFSIWTLKGTEPPPPPPCGDFFLPNAFSPNGDGKNEFFRPRSICIKTLDFRIYNRWGNMVYASNSPTDSGWDGTTPKNGKDGNEGVYSYELNATLLNGTVIVKKGTVTLLK